jgi:AP-3 complex subunit beta
LIREERPVQPVTAPPRSAIVPEYDEESSEEESEEETEEENSEDEAERAPLYGRYS